MSVTMVDPNISYSTSIVLIGPAYQILGSLMLIPWIPSNIRTSSTSTIHKWRMAQLARIGAAVIGVLAVFIIKDSDGNAKGNGYK